MSKIKLTKNELKRQKDFLKMYERYLPTLILKQQQLQAVIQRTDQEMRTVREEFEKMTDNLARWIGVFGDTFPVGDYIDIDKLEIDNGNIAGVDIPLFKSIAFDLKPYDLFTAPVWVDKGVETVKESISLRVQMTVLEIQLTRLQRELAITTQRVNLFEKVKIPESKENIRRIRIYLGDEQTAAVVRGKIAKNNIVKAN